MDSSSNNNVSDVLRENMSTVESTSLSGNDVIDIKGDNPELTCNNKIENIAHLNGEISDVENFSTSDSNVSTSSTNCLKNLFSSSNNNDESKNTMIKIIDTIDCIENIVLKVERPDKHLLHESSGIETENDVKRNCTSNNKINISNASFNKVELQNASINTVTDINKEKEVVNTIDKNCHDSKSNKNVVKTCIINNEDNSKSNDEFDTLSDVRQSCEKIKENEICPNDQKNKQDIGEMCITINDDDDHSSDIKLNFSHSTSCDDAKESKNVSDDDNEIDLEKNIHKKEETYIALSDDDNTAKDEENDVDSNPLNIEKSSENSNDSVEIDFNDDKQNPDFEEDCIIINDDDDDHISSKDKVDTLDETSSDDVQLHSESLDNDDNKDLCDEKVKDDHETENAYITIHDDDRVSNDKSCDNSNIIENQKPSINENHGDEKMDSSDDDIEILEEVKKEISNDSTYNKIPLHSPQRVTDNFSSPDCDSSTDLAFCDKEVPESDHSGDIQHESQDKPLDMSLTNSENAKDRIDSDNSNESPCNKTSLNLEKSDTSVLKLELEKNNTSSIKLELERNDNISLNLEKDAKKISESDGKLIKPTFEKPSKKDTGFPDLFEGLVTIGSYEPVMGDFTLKSNEALIDCPSLVAPFLVKEPDAFPSSETKEQPKNSDIFTTSIGNFLIGIGFSRVREWYHKDMSRIKLQRIKKCGKSEELQQELKNHQTNYLQAKKANEPFALSYKECEHCDYKTDSAIVLEGHMLAPHLTQRREFRCSYCSYFHRDPKQLLNHMKISHNKIGHIEPVSMGYECSCCIFETNSKAKLSSHLNRCLKYFTGVKNQAPLHDFEFPCLTPKPITVSIVKLYEKSVSPYVMPSRGRPKKDLIQDYHQSSPNFQPISYNQGSFKPLVNMPFLDSSPNQFIPRPDQIYPNTNSSFTPILPLQQHTNSYPQTINMPGLPNNLGSHQLPYVPPNKKAKKSHSTYTSPATTCNVQQANKVSVNANAKGLPQLPRLLGPFPSPAHKDNSSPDMPLTSNNLVVCEICDGYIKDLEQLRMHMQLIHKVKIHPKMLSSRPPLNCQKCLWRFFTDHGLERHLLGAHGLVTSNMQELANKNKDTGCCTICGRVYASKLVAHMHQVHKVSLKPAHLSYKCTVCSATFALYRLFESHVYLVHAGGTKRPQSSENSPVPKKSLKLNAV